MIRDVVINQTEILSDKKYTLKNIYFEYKTENGEQQKKANEVYDRGNAAAILLYHPENKTVLLTKQFRMPTFINGNSSGMLIEVCAGLLEENEKPEDCIKREVEEELGYQLKEVQKVFETYTSAGGLTELLHLFVASYNETMKIGEGGGLEEEQENIDVLEMPFQEALNMIANGELKDAKTIMLLQHARLQQLL